MWPMVHQGDDLACHGPLPAGHEQRLGARAAASGRGRTDLVIFDRAVCDREAMGLISRLVPRRPYVAGVAPKR
jgi:hypothetical protein